MPDALQDIRSIYEDMVDHDDTAMMEFDAAVMEHDRQLSSRLLGFSNDELKIIHAVFSAEYNPIDDNVEDALIRALGTIRRNVLHDDHAEDRLEPMRPVLVDRSRVTYRNHDAPTPPRYDRSVHRRVMR